VTLRQPDYWLASSGRRNQASTSANPMALPRAPGASPFVLEFLSRIEAAVNLAETVKLQWCYLINSCLRPLVLG
jgi:hypothetical protein